MNLEDSYTTRDPVALRPHPLVKTMVRWANDSPEWGAFVDDIAARGIVNPLKITQANVVIDGETRRQAAVDLQMTQVPVVVVDEAEAVETIIRELVLRRNLTKGQLAYVAYPLVAEAHADAIRKYTTSRVENLKKGPFSPSSYSVAAREEKGVSALAGQLGISLALFKQAAEIHEKIAVNPALKELVEASIFDPESPAGLGAIKAGIGYLERTGKFPETRRGGIQGAERQLELWTITRKEEVIRWKWWREADTNQRAAHWRKVRELAAALPPDDAAGLAEYHLALSRTFRKAAGSPGAAGTTPEDPAADDTYPEDTDESSS